MFFLDSLQFLLQRYSRSVFYVLESGSDSETSDGSLSKPWKTISYALNRFSSLGYNFPKTLVVGYDAVSFPLEISVSNTLVDLSGVIYTDFGSADPLVTISGYMSGLTGASFMNNQLTPSIGIRLSGSGSFLVCSDLYVTAGSLVSAESNCFVFGNNLIGNTALTLSPVVKCLVACNVLDGTTGVKISKGDVTRLPSLVLCNDIKSTIPCDDEDYEYHGTDGVGAEKALSSASASWGTDVWVGYTLIDSDGSIFKISSNTANILTLKEGTPADGNFWIVGTDVIFLGNTYLTYTNASSYVWGDYNLDGVIDQEPGKRFYPPIGIGSGKNSSPDILARSYLGFPISNVDSLLVSQQLIRSWFGSWTKVSATENVNSRNVKVGMDNYFSMTIGALIHKILLSYNTSGDVSGTSIELENA